MNDKQLAEKIFEYVGGNSNIDSVTHCVTRLRIIVKDVSKIDQKSIEGLNVIGINLVGTQFQVILGGKVDDVYNEFVKLVSNNKSDNTVKEKKSIVSRLVDTLTGIFTPILPAIIGAGLLKGVLLFLSFFGIAETGSNLYQFLSIFSDASYYFLPMLLAVSSATYFKCNKYIALAIAGIMLHPSFIKMVASDGPLTLLGLPVFKTTYGSSVLPIILSIFIMSYIEKLFNKIIPNILRTILVPLCTILVTAPIALIVVGPIGSIISNALASNFLNFYMHFGMLAGAIFSGLLPFMIMLGIHNGFTPVMVQCLGTYGVDYLMGLNVASNSAQAGATFAVFLKTKNKDFKSMAGTAALNAIIGITEPALYGITAKLKKPLIAVSIGGAVGGAIAGFFGVTATGMGTGPIAGIPLFMTNTFIYFVISCVAAFIIALVLTFVIGFEDIPEENENVSDTEFVESVSVDQSSVTDEKIYAPLTGKLIPLEKVNDAVFSSKMMGDGAAIIPEDGKVYAPCDGVVTVAFPTGHAMGIKSNHGCELLIHAGLNTVELNGEGFSVFKKVDDKVSKGDLLFEFDKEFMEKKGYDMTTPIIITNTSEYNKIDIQDLDECKIGDAVLNLYAKEGE